MKCSSAARRSRRRRVEGPRPVFLAASARASAAAAHNRSRSHSDLSTHRSRSRSRPPQNEHFAQTHLPSAGSWRAGPARAPRTVRTPCGKWTGAIGQLPHDGEAAFFGLFGLFATLSRSDRSNCDKRSSAAAASASAAASAADKVRVGDIGRFVLVGLEGFTSASLSFPCTCNSSGLGLVSWNVT